MADRRERAFNRVRGPQVLRHWQQLGLAVREALLCGCALALRAMPVAAAVVGDRRVRAVLAARNVAAERGRAAALDCRHDLDLDEAHMAGVGRTPGGPWSRKMS